jgi:hypothetical protein
MALNRPLLKHALRIARLDIGTAKSVFEKGEIPIGSFA